MHLKKKTIKITDMPKIGKVKQLIETVKLQTKEYIHTANKLDSKLQEGVRMNQNLKKIKAENPAITFEEMREPILELMKHHQTGVLMLKDIEGIMHRLTVITELATLLEIDLGLEGEEKEVIDEVSKSTKLFFAAKGEEIIQLNPDIINSFIAQTTERQLTDEALQNIFNGL
jgi:hypothetical protein